MAMMERGSSMESHNNNLPRRQIRLRAACNQCHIAKVRCTGEKTGCSRCQRLHQQCLYSISQVGRGSGILNKNNRFNDRQGQHYRSPTRNTSDDASSMLDDIGHGRASIPLQDGSSINWTNAEDQGDILDQLDLEWDLSEYLDICDPHDTATDISSILAEFQNPSPELDSDGASSNYSITTVKSLLPTPAGSEYSSTPTLMTRDDSGSSYLRTDNERSLKQSRLHPASPPDEGKSDTRRSISSCAKLVEYVDTESFKNPRALDQVMQINQVVICEIIRIQDIKVHDTNVACQMLIHTALDAIVALFESSVQSASPAALIPDLLLGSFQVTSEQQSAFRIHCVVTEIQRTIRAIDGLNNNQNVAQSKPGCALRIWSAAMIQRLKTVITAVEEAG